MLRKYPNFFPSLTEALKLSEKKITIDRSELPMKFLSNMVFWQVITCPNGMGKTYNLKIIRKFFDIEENDKDNYFDSAINKHLLCTRDQNNYPVVTISFEHFQGDTFDQFYLQFKSLMIELFEKHLAFAYKRFEHTSNIDIQDELIDLKKYKESCAKDPNEYAIGLALHILCRGLYYLYKQSVILLIDDLDLPKFINKDPKINEFISDWLLGFNNDFIERCMITQAQHDPLRFPKKPTFCFNMLKDKYKFDYGFSKNEVITMLGSLATEEILKPLEAPELPGRRYHPAKVLSYVSSQSVTWHITPEFEKYFEPVRFHRMRSI